MGSVLGSNIHDIVEQITCRIQSSNSIGSGVILSPRTASHVYILTARHVIESDDLRKQASHKITVYPQNQAAIECNSKNLILFDEDMAVIVLEDPGISIPSFRLVSTRFTTENCFFRGFPHAYGGEQGVTIDVGFTENGIVSTNKPLADHESDAQFNCMGFSGGGVFCAIEKEVYLLGILYELQEPFQRFKVHDLASVNSYLTKHGLPTLTFHTLPEEIIREHSAESSSIRARSKDTSQSLDTIPTNLAKNVEDGRVVLFITRSALRDAANSEGTEYPTTELLSAKIIEHFLGTDFQGYPVERLIELAISENNLLRVQESIASYYYPFYPTAWLQQVPKYVWHTIATTAIDLVLERAYSHNKESLQVLVPFIKNGEWIEKKLRESNSVQYLKLHGCITAINDVEVPLILTQNQYSSLQRGRSRLFDRLQEMAYEFPFLILTGSLSDPDINVAVQLLSNIQGAKPMSYIVSESKTDAEVRLLKNKRISHIHMKPSEFLTQLDSLVPPAFRVLANLKPKDTQNPISKHLKDGVPEPSSSLESFLSNDVQLVHSNLKAPAADPNAFYKGHFNDFGPIMSNLDVRRKMVDDILSEVFLTSESKNAERAEFYVIKGHAGSGKSVLLQRLAWDAAIDFDLICLIMNRSTFPDYEPISELYRLCGKRIFLFVDPVRDYKDLIEEYIFQARQDNVSLTIVGAERWNTWNSECKDLDGFVTQDYGIRYLSESDLRELATLLERHHSLGYLEELEFDQRIERLKYQAGRQLLVALHEATHGKPFGEIVYDEYSSILDPRARSLYLTVCIFHRLDVPVRAGLISRVHGIRFSEFQERLFQPLEYIVFGEFDKRIQDYVYRSRHSHIAEIIFERVLRNEQERFDEYVRIINAINIDYDSDYTTFKGLINAKQLLELFDFQRIQQLFLIAEKCIGTHPMLLQQKAIFEMNGPRNLDEAQDLLERAHLLAPYNKAIGHSLSVLARRRAQDSTNALEKAKYRAEAREIATSLARSETVSSYPRHTLIQLDLDELEDQILEVNDEPALQRQILRLEELINTTLQVFPDDEFLRTAEARFYELMRQNSNAMNALERAFVSNKASPYIAVRLAKMYRQNREINKAITTLQESIEFSPSARGTHFLLARILLEEEVGASKIDIKRHLVNSFTKGDQNYLAQFWYARFLYLEGEISEATEYFRLLQDTNADHRTKIKPRGIVRTGNGENEIFAGTLTGKESTYGFIKRDKLQDDIFVHKDNSSDSAAWESLERNARVRFELGFNYKGPIAVNVRAE